jgi:hypothetical protein
MIDECNQTESTNIIKCPISTVSRTHNVSHGIKRSHSDVLISTMDDVTDFHRKDERVPNMNADMGVIR